MFLLKRKTLYKCIEHRVMIEIDCSMRVKSKVTLIGLYWIKSTGPLFSQKQLILNCPEIFFMIYLKVGLVLKGVTI
ncbi:hypothetical protein C6Y45_05150 [Alkalicoccus saliphilus]|uniref:Uncharacterized protein n=1 Tax=Alkalicoccus saliphilus TaxID=200989 RepID=A0A2T4U8I5_9BACI|nr:hypothetical protein C6Y45_05150 [Alkalicoccus saliphilus]